MNKRKKLCEDIEDLIKQEWDAEKKMDLARKNWEEAWRIKNDAVKSLIEFDRKSK